MKSSFLKKSNSGNHDLNDNQPRKLSASRSHKLFCEMDVFSDFEWKEAARWLKFEEDVENGGRWSKPHVATLSLHSLFELRSAVSNGIVLLDFPGDNLIDIIDGITNYAHKFEYVDEFTKERLKTILKLKHVHQHEKIFQKQLDIGIKKSIPFVKSIVDLKKSSTPSTLNDIGSSSLEINPQANKSNSSIPKLSFPDPKHKINQNLMRKISNETEASNILIGEVGFLDHQFTAFVRLSKPSLFGDLTEISVPTRFLTVLLGPKGSIEKNYEMGRSIATLMSDEIFQDAIYRVENQQDILAAIDDFVNQTVVLPPGEWDQSIRLEPPSNVLKKEQRLQLLAKFKHNQASRRDSAIKPLLGSLQHVSESELDESHEIAGLTYTGRFCGGLFDDIKRKAPFYISDFLDGFNFQCISSILFMYFACLSPIITFGGLLGAATDLNMSAFESLLSGAICGILFSLLAGQPLTILGSTGPVLIFETILNNFSKANEIDYMGFRAWIGLWTCVFLIIIVVSDSSFLVKYITRFTEECFAALIAFIFIKESITKLLEIRHFYKFSYNPKTYVEQNCCFLSQNSNTTDLKIEMVNCASKNMKCQYIPDVFFFSVILFMLTFLVAMSFKWFRNSNIFSSTVRIKISEFGVVITILLMVLLDNWIGMNTPKLIVPLEFQTTKANRGWFINPIERNKDKWWLFLVAIIPALLSTILIFMDQHITVLIVNRSENKLKKSYGYHLDMLIVAICIGINSLLGIPWFVAATVLSINHVLSLKKESEATAPGERPKFLGVIEQRVTGTIVFVLIGSSVFLAQYLRKIPMPVLYGIFLYMGISSLNGIQFMHRVILIFMPEKHQPDYIFLRHVRTAKVHFFTAIQIASLGLLFLIKMTKNISILFPIMVVGLVFIRKMMEYLFTEKELFYLDDVFKKKSKQKDKCSTILTTIPNCEPRLSVLSPPEIIVFDIDESNYQAQVE